MKVIIKNLQKKIPISPKKIREVVLRALSSEGKKIPGEITVCFVNDRQITELNLLYLAENNPTDVIAFNNSGNKREVFADIAVSTDTACRNARIFKTTPLYEVYLYIAHGVLHILGFDDNTPRKRKIMENKAAGILSALHITH